MKILHLTFHNGCAFEIEGIMSTLGHTVTRITPERDYNIGHDRAAELWNKYGAEWSRYDLVLTSDTAPLARPFLQAGYQGPLLIWICNRFDYADQATNRVGFPDSEFYDLFRAALDNPRVAIVPNTQFENVYCATKGISLCEPIIKPTGIYAKTEINTNYLEDPRCFVIPRHNETVLLDLSSKLNMMGIPSIMHNYNEPSQIIQYKALIHIPYAWSTFAGFANAGAGLTTFIPTQRFLQELFFTNQNGWFQNWGAASLDIAECYDPSNASFYCQFDSWNDLVEQLSFFQKEETIPEVLAIWQNNYLQQLTKWSIVIKKITA